MGSDDDKKVTLEANPPVVSSSAKARRRTLARQSTHIDLVTGRQTTRAASVKKVLQEEQQEAKTWLKQKLQLLGRRTRIPKAAEPTSTSLTREHFRITSHGKETSSKRREKAWWRRYSAGVTNDYLRWTFRASFTAVTVALFANFFVCVVAFAALIYGYGRQKPGCIYVGNEEFESTFMDAYQLSWTTFSTVGYGLTGPKNGKQCIGLNILMAYEAFLGVLFGGLAGAVIIGKVARIQSIAQVRFSDPICVRFGTGAMDTAEKEEDDDDEKMDGPGLPCPVLEFRMMNELSSEKGGEIMNASVNVVASVLANDDESTPSLVHKTNASLNPHCSLVEKVAKASTEAVSVSAVVAKTALFGARRRASNATGSLIQKLNHTAATGIPVGMTGSNVIPEAEPFKEISSESLLEKKYGERLLKKLQEKRQEMAESAAKQVTIDEGNAALAPPRIYYKLNIETDRHPFFKRVWIIRHVLDETSPLLSESSRRMIRDNGGCCPESLNCYEAIRENVRFNDIIVSFSGTANVSGSSVYAQKVYDYVDMNVGYTFANILALKNDQLVVDAVLLNDVKEQNGGGAEPLSVSEEVRHMVMDTVGKVKDKMVRTGEAVTLASRLAREQATDSTKAAVDGVTTAASALGEKFHNEVNNT